MPAGVSQMPSPRWPMRVMQRCSVTHAPEQELAIAVAAENRGGHEPGYSPAQGPHECGNGFADRSMHGRIAHYSLLHRSAPGLELRLDQRNEMSAGARQGERGRQHQGKRDEAHIDRDEIESRRERGGVQPADIHAFQRYDSWVRPQGRMQLAMA